MSKKKRVLIGLAVLSVSAAAAFAYGPASPAGISGSALAQEMEDQGWGEDGENKLSNLRLPSQLGSQLRLHGHHARRGGLSETSASYEVIVNFDGNWIARPESAI